MGLVVVLGEVTRNTKKKTHIKTRGERVGSDSWVVGAPGWAGWVGFTRDTDKGGNFRQQRKAVKTVRYMIASKSKTKTQKNRGSRKKNNTAEEHGIERPLPLSLYIIYTTAIAKRGGGAFGTAKFFGVKQMNRPPVEHAIIAFHHCNKKNSRNFK